MGEVLVFAMAAAAVPLMLSMVAGTLEHGFRGRPSEIAAAAFGALVMMFVALLAPSFAFAVRLGVASGALLGWSFVMRYWLVARRDRPTKASGRC